MATLVDNKEDILTNVRTFNNYREGTDSERKFYKRGLRNCSFFIAEKLDGRRYKFTPANFVAYKNTSIATHYTGHNSIRSDTKQAISRALGPGRENGEIDVEFYDYCTQHGSTKKTPRKEPLRYWIIDDVVAAREGEAGKLSDEATTTETTPEPSGAVATSFADIDDERSQSEDEAGVVIASSNGLNTEDIRQKILRLGLVEAIKQDAARAGMDRTGVYPLRTVPNDLDVEQMLVQKWHDQNGLCALCDKPIPRNPTNKLLQLSRDRADSAKKTYDWQNTQLTHLACNLGKSDATVDEWLGYLAMVRQPSPS